MPAAVASAPVWPVPLVRLPPASSSTPGPRPDTGVLSQEEAPDEPRSDPSASGRAGGELLSKSVGVSPTKFPWSSSRAVGASIPVDDVVHGFPSQIDMLNQNGVCCVFTFPFFLLFLPAGATVQKLLYRLAITKTLFTDT